MKDFKVLGALKPDGLGVVYEDDDILAANKPVNMLSQKSKETDISANERLIGYLIKRESLILTHIRALSHRCATAWTETHRG